jgi:hypothetical protein
MKAPKGVLGNRSANSIQRNHTAVGIELLTEEQYRKGESLIQLLTRLDQAIAMASRAGVFTDEINSPPDSTRR